MKGLDVKDRKLIYQLCKNSRQGFSKIASNIGVSKNSVKYRVDRLKNMGIIYNFMPIINIGLVGWNTFDIFLRFNVKPEEEKEIIEFFKNYPHVVWMASLSGKWDMLLEVAVKNWEMYGKILSDITSFLGEKLDRYETYVALYVYKVVPIVKDFYQDLGLPELEKPRIHGYVELDKTDKNILSLLSEDGLMPQYKIASKLEISPDTVAYRMKKLEKNGVIVSYIPALNMTKLGYNQYIAIINLKSISNEKLRMLKSYFVQNKNIQYAFHGATRMEVFLNIYAKTPEEMDELLKDIKNRFFENIQDYTYMLVTGDHVFNLFPEIMSKKE